MSSLAVLSPRHATGVPITGTVMMGEPNNSGNPAELAAAWSLDTVGEPIEQSASQCDTKGLQPAAGKMFFHARTTLRDQQSNPWSQLAGWEPSTRT